LAAGAAGGELPALKQTNEVMTVLTFLGNPLAEHVRYTLLTKSAQAARAALTVVSLRHSFHSCVCVHPLAGLWPHRAGDSWPHLTARPSCPAAAHPLAWTIPCDRGTDL